MVLDLAVVDDALFAAVAGGIDGLVTAAAVNDGQSQVDVDGARRTVQAKVAGTTVVKAASEVRGCALQDRRVDLMLEMNACNATHARRAPELLVVERFSEVRARC